MNIIKTVAFICGSPLHLLISKIFIEHFKLLNVDLIYTNKTIEKNITLYNSTWNNLYYYNSNTNLFGLLKNTKSLDKLQYEEVFIFNDFILANQFILNKIKFNKLTYIDDGVTLISNFTENTDYKGANLVVRKLFNLNIHRRLLSDNRIGEAYLFNHKKVNFSPSRDLSEIVVRNKKIILSLSESLDHKFSFSGKYNENYDYLILTQPLTEYKVQSSNVEVEVIYNFIREILRRDTKLKIKIGLKIHPKESLEKYKSILNYFQEEVSVIREGNEYPYEIQHFLIRPKKIVSFYTTAFYTISLFDEKVGFISLVDQLDIDSKYKETLLSFDINRLEFF